MAENCSRAKYRSTTYVVYIYAMKTVVLIETYHQDMYEQLKSVQVSYTSRLSLREISIMRATTRT